MALMIKKQRNGQIRPFWYGVYKDSEKRRVVNLNVPVKGIPPPNLSLKGLGDTAFERSRAMAEAVLRQITSVVQSK